jgi:hypothetical protein
MFSATPLMAAFTLKFIRTAREKAALNHSALVTRPAATTNAIT